MKGWGSPDIDKYGIAAFADRCRESVTRHTDALATLTERVGYWLDLDAACRTMDPEYLEYTWGSLQQIFAKGLVKRVRHHGREHPYTDSQCKYA